MHVMLCTHYARRFEVMTTLINNIYNAKNTPRTRQWRTSLLFTCKLHYNMFVNFSVRHIGLRSIAPFYCTFSRFLYAILLIVRPFCAVVVVNIFFINNMYGIIIPQRTHPGPTNITDEANTA
jgi:hypothetical protein